MRKGVHRFEFVTILRIWQKQSLMPVIFGEKARKLMTVCVEKNFEGNGFMWIENVVIL